LIRDIRDTNEWTIGGLQQGAAYKIQIQALSDAVEEASVPSSLSASTCTSQPAAASQIQFSIEMPAVPAEQNDGILSGPVKKEVASVSMRMRVSFNLKYPQMIFQLSTQLLRLRLRWNRC